MDSDRTLNIPCRPADGEVFGDCADEISNFLGKKSKEELITLLVELVQQFPEVSESLADRIRLQTTDHKKLIRRLSRELDEVTAEPGWREYRGKAGYTPDYSGIRSKMGILVDAGFADDVLRLARKLLEKANSQIEMSRDDGETAMEAETCMPAIAEALRRSSLDPVDKLQWAIHFVLEDAFDICGPIYDYLSEEHSRSAWSELADRLVHRLKESKPASQRHEFSAGMKRDLISNWAMRALDAAGREEEILALCRSEARATSSYVRLVDLLIALDRHQEAEEWILEGVQATKQEWPGIAGSLRDKRKELYTMRREWPTVAAMEVEDFVRHPSWDTFQDCRRAATRLGVWKEVRTYLLDYLQDGREPGTREAWPLPASGFEHPENHRPTRFPQFTPLIEIAIEEKRPEQVLYWYDRRPKNRLERQSMGADRIARAIQAHAPDRAVAIWKGIAEDLIDKVKPVAYEKAGWYLRQAAEVMVRENRDAEWRQYMLELRTVHRRKRRLVEILDTLDDVSTSA